MIKSISLVPNPTNGKSKLSCRIDHCAKMKISLYNHFGQHIKNIFNGEINAGVYEYEIDFKSLGLEIGMYTLAVTIDGETTNSKVVYDK